MAGKVDSSTYAAAIARVGEATRREADVWAHVDEIVKGPAFRGSSRSQAFLRHIVERALHGDSTDLRERSIGIALFGRSAAYDTADDAIVRVSASDVRKRLLQHYGTAGVDASVRISLPPGSYIPEFSFVLPDSLQPAAPASPSELPVEPAEQPRTLPGNLELVDAIPKRSKFAVPRLPVVIALVAVVVVAAVLLAPVVNRRHVPVSTPSLLSAAFEGNSSATQIVVADDALVLIQVLLDRRFTLQEYENLAYLQPPEFVAKKELQRFWASLSTRQITNIGDLNNANRIVEALRAQNREVIVRQSRQMHARSFRNGNFVILGSSFSNPWADLFSIPESNFPTDGLPRPGKPQVFLNRHPLPGEPGRFDAFRDPNTGNTITFARVTLMDNLARNGRVILVAGQSVSATEMAGELLLRPESATRVRRMLGVAENAPLPDLEMVLRISEQNEIGDRAKIVSARKLPRHFD